MKSFASLPQISSTPESISRGFIVKQFLVRIESHLITLFETVESFWEIACIGRKENRFISSVVIVIARKRRRFFITSLHTPARWCNSIRARISTFHSRNKRLRVDWVTLGFCLKHFNDKLKTTKKSFRDTTLEPSPAPCLRRNVYLNCFVSSAIQFHAHAYSGKELILKIFHFAISATMDERWNTN